MSEHREPLGALSTNIPVPQRDLYRLAPIFTKFPAHTRPTACPSRPPQPLLQISSSPPDVLVVTPSDRDQDDAGPSRKRVKRSSSPCGECDLSGRRAHIRIPSMHDFFAPVSPLRSDGYDIEKSKEVVVAQRRGREDRAGQIVWRRPRRRLGVDGFSRVDTMGSMSEHRCESNEQLFMSAFCLWVLVIAPQPRYLSTLVTSIAPYHPLIPPSILLIPSLHPPTGRPRDFAPPLCVAFNTIAKQWDAPDTKSAGLRRLIAVAGEEGGVRILDVDEGLGSHREEKGFWWRAHSNAVFDVKWSGDDTRMVCLFLAFKQ